MKKTLFLSIIAAVLASCCPADKTTINVVPYPNSVEMKCGSFAAAGAEFKCDPAMDEASKAVVETFAQQLSYASGKQSTVSEGSAKTGFTFTLNQDMPAEAYTLKVGKKGVKVEASGLNGFNYAVQTLKQMLPAEIYGMTEAADADWTIPCTVINDAPRFGYRGMHLDISRHFYDIDAVKRYLDIMEIH